MNPKKLDSAVVGSGLLFFGTFYLILGGFIEMNLPSWVLNSVKWVIPSIFLLRAMGDFKYVGFFKKVKDTKFGQKDSQIFSPLCLMIALLGFSLQFY